MGPSLFLARDARPIVISVADDDDFLSKAELMSIQKGLEDIQTAGLWDAGGREA